MTLNNIQPLFNPGTHYRIEVRGHIDVDWLQSFNATADVMVDQNSPMEGITVLNMHTDQSGIVGLVRRLHSLGMTILQLEIVTDEGKATKGEK